MATYRERAEELLAGSALPSGRHIEPDTDEILGAIAYGLLAVAEAVTAQSGSQH